MTNGHTTGRRPWPLRTLIALLRGALGLLILFEEWGWEPLQRALARLGRLPPVRQLEAAITRLGPRGALAVLALPSLLLVPVKIAALWLIAHQHALLGATVIVGAKLAGTALVARLYALTRPALMHLAWFARAMAHWTAWKAALLAQVRASALWRGAQAWRARARRTWRGWRRRLGTGADTAP